MTIRGRLTWWYAGILLVSSALLTAWWVDELGEERTKVAGVAENGGWSRVLAATLWCGIPVAVLAVTGGWWMMCKALAPIAALTEAAGQIQEHNLRERLPRSGNGDELDRLTEVFNGMTGRLAQSFQRVREFTLHASHELKTPLTVMHGQLETALRDPASPAEHRELLHSQLEEVQRLTRIVDGLTLLAKADAGQVALACAPVRLDELVREAHADALILAQPRQIDVALRQLDPVTLAGDHDRLRQLLLNLSDNAIKYNHARGQVTIDLRARARDAELTIANTGPGIAPEILPRVFDRFFRGDAERYGWTEGCGLGLSIAQWIVTAHGGEIRIDSTPETTTVVTVRLPQCAA